jgi:hypothetical protein
VQDETAKISKKIKKLCTLSDLRGLGGSKLLSDTILRKPCSISVLHSEVYERSIGLRLGNYEEIVGVGVG